MAEKTGLMDVIEQKLVPLANMVGKNKYLLTLRDTFSMIMPLLIVGSIFTLIGSFPFEPWTNFLKGVQVGDQTLFCPGGCPGNYHRVDDGPVRCVSHRVQLCRA